MKRERLNIHIAKSAKAKLRKQAREEKKSMTMLVEELADRRKPARKRTTSRVAKMAADHVNMKATEIDKYTPGYLAKLIRTLSGSALAQAGVILLFFAFAVLPAEAHDDGLGGQGGLCKCTLVERLPEWIALHDEWWVLNVALHEQQREYARITGKIEERESMLSKKQLKKYVRFAKNPAIEAYEFPQHPTEDAANNIPVSQAHVEAAFVQLATQFVPEVQRAAAHLQYLRGFKIRQ